MKRTLLLLLLVWPYYVSAQDFVRPSNSDSIAYMFSQKISVDSISKNLNKLASPEFEGRGTGQPGQKLAGEFLMNKYASYYLDGYAVSKHEDDWTLKEDFLQWHPTSLRMNKGRNLSVNGENYLYGKDFIYPTPTKDSTLFINKFLFIAAGKSNGKTYVNEGGSYNKYAPDADLGMILTSEQYDTRNILIDYRENIYEILSPLSEKPKSPGTVFIITPEAELLNMFRNDYIEKTYPFPVFFISETIAQQMVDVEDYLKIKSKAKKKGKTLIKEIDEASISIGLVRNSEILRGENVVARLEGTDKSGETIIISSHYDHLGKNDSTWFPGADDNASGTTAVLEIARIFKLAADEGWKPKRNIIFLNVSGEERGLLGSSWFVAHPPLPLDSIVANLNIDMIGRIDSIHDSTGVKNYVYVIGADKLSTELHVLNEEQNKKYVKLDLDYKYNSDDDPNRFYKRSDHYNFAKKGIPVAFYFDGKHKDYHEPSDTPEKIDLQLLTTRTRLIFLTAWELANRDKRIIVDKKPE